MYGERRTQRLPQSYARPGYNLLRKLESAGLAFKTFEGTPGRRRYVWYTAPLADRKLARLTKGSAH